MKLFGKTLGLIYFLNQCILLTGFTSSTPFMMNTVSLPIRKTQTTIPLLASYEKLPDIIDEDEDGVRITKVRKLERDWTYVRENGERYISNGSMQLKVFVPNGKIKGCAFFMHGFSQYPKAYRQTLMRAADKANIVIIAPETGIFSGFVLKNIFSNLPSLVKDRNYPQFVLQMSLSEDMKQCIRMVLADDPKFKEFGMNKRMPMAVCGHSMGGGLSFPVAAEFPQINHVFAMAPAYGVEEFLPIEMGVKKRIANSSMMLAGYWDLIAPWKKVEKISGESNISKKDSSIFVGISRGLHTGFEDELVIGQVDLTSIISLFLGPGVFVEKIIIFAFLGFIRNSTGQLEGTELLMEYYLDQMAKGRKVTVESADKYLEDNIKTTWDKFDIRYGVIEASAK